MFWETEHPPKLWHPRGQKGEALHALRKMRKEKLEREGEKMTRPVKTNHVQDRVNATSILSRENRSDLGIDYYYHCYQECERVAATLKLGQHSMLIYTRTQKLNHHWNKRTRERERKRGKMTRRERGCEEIWVAFLLFEVFKCRERIAEESH